MKLTVSNEAASWYKEELSLSPPAFVRFFPRYGFGGHIPGFSIGISNQSPTEVYKSTEVDQVTFFIENEDAWYFQDINLNVNFNETLQEAEFTYQ